MERKIKSVTETIEINKSFEETINLLNEVRAAATLIDELTEARKKKIKEVRDTRESFEKSFGNKELTEAEQELLVNLKNLEESLTEEMVVERQSYLLDLEARIEHELNSNEDELNSNED